MAKINRLATDTIDHSQIEVWEPDVEVLVEEFKYKIKPTDTHKRFMQLADEYWKNNEKFMKKANITAGIRARKCLIELFHICRQRRAEISESSHEIRAHHQEIIKELKRQEQEEKANAS